MSRHMKIMLLLPLLLAACAIGDVSSPTPVPPVTLMPPPEISFQGDCNVTPDLEMWLQITTQLRDDFLLAMNETAAKSKTEMHAGVLMMAAVRDAAYQVTTPDCTSEVELALSDTMTEAVNVFQAYVNGDRPDLGNAVAVATERFERIAALQQELELRLETQIWQEQETAEPG